MKFKFNIPNKINVGYQERGDTYTGKLAYVTYTDAKGMLRKKHSWDGWRNHKIEPEEFENVPTSGFVLNKKVGDGGYGWNPRKAWVRVYDPRGFEFEISVNNLVFILEECSSIKGKGLEGELVYAWDRADLLLLPVSSKEYIDSMTFQKASLTKITKKEIKIGGIYLHKENEEVMYLGREKCWFYDDYSKFYGEKRHVFLRLNPPKLRNVEKYFFEKGFTNLNAVIESSSSLSFAEEYDAFKASRWGAGPEKLIEEPIELKNDTFSQNAYGYILTKEGYKGARYRHYTDGHKEMSISTNVVRFSEDGVYFDTDGYELNNRYDKEDMIKLSIQTKNGTVIDISDDYF